jgi:hypothetical protein
MKFSVAALVSALAISTTSAFSSVRPHATSHSSSTSLNYSVGIVGATGAVGKEIRQCLENRGKLTVDKLRIFGSPRSAGSTVETKYGDVEVELFSEEATRECDVVFLAVDGDFALEHAHNICEGDDGAVVIDNSVCKYNLYHAFCSFRNLVPIDFWLPLFPTSIVCLPLQARDPIGCP